MQKCTLICIYKIQGNCLDEEKIWYDKDLKQKHLIRNSAVITRWQSRRQYGLIKYGIWYNENQWIERTRERTKLEWTQREVEFRQKFSSKSLKKSLQSLEFKWVQEKICNSLNKLHVVCAKNIKFTNVIFKNWLTS